jgi:hypothetical protein
MGKAAARLTVVKARALIAKGNPARHGDGGNLYLHVTGPGKALWSFRFMRQGKSREMGIGVADPEGRLGGVTLAEARERTAAASGCCARASTRLTGAGRRNWRPHDGDMRLAPSAKWPNYTLPRTSRAGAVTGPH